MTFTKQKKGLLFIRQPRGKVRSLYSEKEAQWKLHRKDKFYKEITSSILQKQNSKALGIGLKTKQKSKCFHGSVA